MSFDFGSAPGFVHETSSYFSCERDTSVPIVAARQVPSVWAKVVRTADGGT